VRVRLFAALREIAGSSSIDAPVTPDVRVLLEVLADRFGEAFGRIMESGTVVVNGRTAGRDQTLSSDDEVALLPPVSGGSWQDRSDRTED